MTVLIEIANIVFIGIVILYVGFPFVMISRQLHDEFRKKRYWLYLPLLICISTVFPFMILIPFYCLYRWKLKKTRRMSLFFASYIYLAYQGLSYFVLSLFQNLFNKQQDSIYVFLFSTLLGLVISIVVIYANKLLLNVLQLDFELLEQESFQGLIRRINGIFSFLILIQLFISYTESVVSSIYKRSLYSTPYTPTIALLVLVAYLACLLYVKNIQDTYLHQQRIQEKEDEIRHFNQYIDKLGGLYDELRGFRHDFAGIVTSLKPAIDAGDMPAVQRIYDQAFLEMHRAISREEYRFFDLKNVEDLAVRSVLANYILLTEQEGIHLHLEIKDKIAVLPIPMLDLIRILHIILDNAVEAGKETKTPEIWVSVMSGRYETVIMVKNNRLPIPLNQRRIWEKGYSSKGDGRGIGLATLLNLVHAFDGVELSTEIGQESFCQILRFKMEEKDENYDFRR